jgi:quercetin dioxygenase-like cupin family protein
LRQSGLTGATTFIPSEIKTLTIMNRKHFLKTSAIGIGTLALAPVGVANTKMFTPKSDSGSNSTEPKIVRKDQGKSQIVLGDHQQLKLSGKDTNGLYTLIEQYNDPGMEIPMHVHQDEDEVFHVLSGSLEVKIGEETKVLSAGDLGFCPKGIPHSWKVVGSEKARVMLSMFPAGLELMFDELAQLPAGPPDMEKLAAICANYNIQFV